MDLRILNSGLSSAIAAVMRISKKRKALKQYALLNILATSHLWLMGSGLRRGD